MLLRLEDELRGALGARVRDVRLFGSYARGEATEESDVDVLVLVDGLEPREIAVVADAATRVALEAGVPLAPLPLASENFEEMVQSGRALAEDIPSRRRECMTATEAMRLAVALEVRHGREALAAARALRDRGMRNDALSRAYYAAFRLASALLLTEGVEPRRDSSIPGLLVSHLGASGFDGTDAARLGRLASYRDLADYERAFDATDEVLGDALRDAEMFVDKALARLRSTGVVEG